MCREEIEFLMEDSLNSDLLKVVEKFLKIIETYCDSVETVDDLKELANCFPMTFKYKNALSHKEPCIVKFDFHEYVKIIKTKKIRMNITACVFNNDQTRLFSGKELFILDIRKNIPEISHIGGIIL